MKTAAKNAEAHCPNRLCRDRIVAAAAMLIVTLAATLLAVRHGSKIGQKCAWQRVNKANKAKRLMRNRISHV
jgi:hypothetical protein